MTEWTTVDREKFLEVVDAVPKELLQVHTVGFCTPPLVFYWDTRLPRKEGWDVYDSAIARYYQAYSPQDA